MDANDIKVNGYAGLKVGDVIQLKNGDVHIIDNLYYNRKNYYTTIESTDGILIEPSKVEKRLNKYHIGDRVIHLKGHHFKGTITKVKECVYSTPGISYEVKMDDTPGSFDTFEEDIIAMDEKKVSFEVGDYVRIDSEKIDSMSSLARYCGHLGIIVRPGYNKNYWKVYFFELKHMGIVDEKFLAKTKCNVTFNEEISLKESYKKYIENDINITKQIVSSSYGCNFNSEKYDYLKELYKRYMELGYDGRAVKSALNFLYGCSMETGKLPKIKKVIFNGPATIVLWGDGDKTVVHCGEGDTMDKEKGLAMAICKKALGKSKTHYDYYNVFKKWIKEENKK